MKIKNLAIIALLCATACNQNGKVNPEKESIKFKAGIAQYVTKATDTAFENNDAISLFAGEPVNATNVKLTYANGELTPAQTLYWGLDQKTATTFDAIYPYNAAYTSAKVDFTVKADQSAAADYKASDFFTATVSAAPSQGTVVLPFTHKMAKLVIKVTNETENEVTAVSMTGVCQTLKADGTADNAGTVKACANGSSWELIVAPQASSPKVVVTTAAGGYTFEGSIDMKSGKKGTIEVKIEKAQPQPDPEEAKFSCTVSDWEEGETFTFTPVTESGDDDDDDDADTKTLTITDTVLPTAYGDNTKIAVDGITFYFNQTANFGNGIQFKKGVGYIANQTSFTKIKSIKLVCQTGKTWTNSCLTLYAGTSENPSTKIASSDSEGLVFDLSGQNCTYFKLANDSANAVYLASVTVAYE
ncbi:MAG: fimbrillin family protein [Bacteroidales bacterium]|nr:fimbrillin family protein [Bacteroidales bacterium]